MHGTDLLLLSGILVAGFACQWIAWRVKLPSILFLLLTGIGLGPLLGWLQPDVLFGDLLEPIVAVAVAVILYEGSITLKFSEIRGHGDVVRNLVTIGVIVTWVAGTFAAHTILGWDLYLAALFGAIVTVSGPTVIMPLLRTARPTKALANILRWEGILVDPLGAIFAVLVYEFIIASQAAVSGIHLIETLGLIVAIGAILGIAAGQAFGIALRKHWLPDYLRDYAALATVLLVFALAEAIETESGLLAVTIMGVWQANMRDLDFEDILNFKESLTLVLVAGLFIVLAARLNLSELRSLGVGAVAVLLFLQFIGGPMRAAVCSIGSSLSWRERMYLGWIFPRGIVAAAVSSLFALRLQNAGYAGAEKLVPLIFTVILGTVIVQSLSGRLVARLLGIVDPDPTGVLVVGANPLALMYAQALHDAGQRVLVASSSWDGIKKARMRGLPVYYGSPVSDYADRNLDLLGLGNLLALSHRPGLNELACVHFKFEFGRDAVFTVKHESEETHEKHRISGESGGRILFGGKYSVNDMLRFILHGAKVRATELSDEFTFADYRSKYPDRLILFAMDANGRLQFPLTEKDMPVHSGYTVAALVMAGTETDA
jgi:CPA1 family monovalent cation:H+ antiporter